jgi:exopolyphosphatase/pppGpp-phosphohydrolase
VIDLGGGSVELAVGEGARCLKSANLPIGALRWSANMPDAFSARDAREIIDRVREQARDALAGVRALQPEIVVFSSGSARSARRLLMRASRTPGKTGPIERAHFRSAHEALLGSTNAQLTALGVDPVRAPSVLAAATIMLELLHGLCASSAFVSDKGLRDGVALELYQQHVTASSFTQAPPP